MTDYIARLLKQHNCVIVPDFGGFIANYKSAVIDEARQQLTPPSKSILFNPNLTTNDGLLGNTIVKEQGIAYPDALTFIREQVAQWQTDLNKGARIEIGEIGFLYRENDQIVFEQSREVNLLLEAYGLSSIRFVNFAAEKKQAEEKPVAVEEKPVLTSVDKDPVVIELKPAEAIEPVMAADEKEADVVALQPVARKKGRWKYLAAAAAIPLLFYSYWIPMQTDFLDTGKIQMADFNPIHQTAERSYENRSNDLSIDNRTSDWQSWDELTGTLSEHVTVYNYQFDDDLYIPVKLNKSVEVMTTEVVMSETTPAAITESVESDVNTPYHIIGGCFSVKENAEKLVADLSDQGFPAKILDVQNGLYRVTAGDYTQRSEAKANLKTVENKGFSAWILKK